MMYYYIISQASGQAHHLLKGFPVKDLEHPQAHEDQDDLYADDLYGWRLAGVLTCAYFASIALLTAMVLAMTDSGEVAALATLASSIIPISLAMLILRARP